MCESVCVCVCMKASRNEQEPFEEDLLCVMCLCVHESISACKHCCFVLVEMMDVVCEMMEKYSLSLQGLS